MFSDRFAVIDRYSLTTREKISTIEIMPRRFTSLMDSSYLPALDPVLIEKFNSYFDFKADHVYDFHHEYEKHFYIEHLDGEVIDYYVKNPIDFPTLVPIALKFANQTGLPEFPGLVPSIRSIVSDNSVSETVVSGVTYKPDGSFSDLTVFNTKYDFSGFESNDFISRVHSFCSPFDDLARGAITFFADTDDISIKLICIPKLIFADQGRGNRYVEMRNTRALEIAEMLATHEALGIITDDDHEFIKSVCTGNTFFDLEFFISPDGTCRETHLYHHVVHDFEDLTAS